jgi:protein ImuA
MEPRVSLPVQRNRAPDERSLEQSRIEAGGLGRSELVARLRQLLPALEGERPDEAALPFGIPAIDGHLPQGGLVAGALHEFTAARLSDMPAAFGFVAALLGRALGEAQGCGLLVLSRRSLADFGRPYAPGLRELRLDPGRLILVETVTDRQALWAVEEALRLRAVPAVAGWVDTKVDLKASRRLHLAAEGSGTLLFLLRPADADEANAAVTRWRIASAPAPRDRFGCFAGWRWRVRLERCRNGRPGEWLVEWSDVELGHGAHPFRLAGTLADPALPPGPEPAGPGSQSAVRRVG